MRYGIATLLEDYPDGYEFTEANTPLHLTHIDAFDIQFDAKILIDKLQGHLHDQRSFTVIPVQDTFFGPNQDIPVTIIELNNELKLFHERLIKFLESAGAVFVNPHFLLESYEPHISIYGPRQVKLGKPIAIKSVLIGNKRTDMENPPNRIIATIPFK